MSTARIDAVLVKLGAVFVVVVALGTLGEFSIYLVGGPEFPGVLALAIAIGFLMPLGIAALLWLYPRVVASLAPTEHVNPSDVAPENLMLSYDELEQVPPNKALGLVVGRHSRDCRISWTSDPQRTLEAFLRRPAG